MAETASVGDSLVWLRGVLVDWIGWVREHLLVTVVLSSAAFVVGWVWNTYLLAAVEEGFKPGGRQTFATAPGRSTNGLFWLLLSSVVAGLATYAWQRGWNGLWRDLGVLPRRFVDTLRDDPRVTGALLLWGAGVALLTATVIGSAVSLLLGVALVALALSPVGVILNFAVIRLWRGLTGVAAPESQVDAAAVSGPFLMMVGEALGLFLDWRADRWPVSLAVGVVAGGGSILLARRGPGVVAALFAVLTTASLVLVQRPRAWADDGGWSECETGSNELCSDAGLGGFLAWFGSDGAPTLIGHASIGGLFSGVGAAVGVGLGAIAAAAPSSAVASAASSAAASASPGSDGAGRHAADPGEIHTLDPDGEPPPDPDRTTAADLSDVLPEPPDRRDEEPEDPEQR